MTSQANIPAQPAKNRWRVAALYKFVAVADCALLKTRLEKICVRHGIKGTLLVASEGVNGTIAGTETALKAALDAITAVPELTGLDYKLSWASSEPFHRMKVRLKKEIVTLGAGDINPADNAGTYVAPADWNNLISDPDTLVIDTRNAYETAIGTFRGATDPKTTAFRDFPDWVARNQDKLKAAKKVAMFCTGGIRCEKSTAYLKQQGFSDVYHLKGGILKYLEEIPEAESLWDGACFVFDERVSVTHGLAEGDHSLCRACRRPLTRQELAHPAYEEGVSCQYCVDQFGPDKKAGFRERQRQEDLARRKGIKHIGAQLENDDPDV